jgi:hypothetical protein
MRVMSEPPVRRISPPAHCEECGFAAATVTAENAEASIRSVSGRYRAPLSRFLEGEDPNQILRRRPDADTWSALEYAAHMRDVIALWGSTLHLALTQDHASLPLPDPSIADRYAADRSYNDQDPSTVAGEITANADRMAVKVAQIGRGQWERLVTVGDEEMSCLAIVAKVAHEAHHHLLDIGRSLRSARAAGN